MYQIRLDLTDDSSKVEGQARQVTPAEFTRPARPQVLV
jgi:hypothetical protein